MYAKAVYSHCPKVEKRMESRNERGGLDKLCYTGRKTYTYQFSS